MNQSSEIGKLSEGASTDICTEGTENRSTPFCKEWIPGGTRCHSVFACSASCLARCLLERKRQLQPVPPSRQSHSARVYQAGSEARGHRLEKGFWIESINRQSGHPAHAKYGEKRARTRARLRLAFCHRCHLEPVGAMCSARSLSCAPSVRHLMLGHLACQWRPVVKLSKPPFATRQTAGVTRFGTRKQNTLPFLDSTGRPGGQKTLAEPRVEPDAPE